MGLTWGWMGMVEKIAEILKGHQTVALGGHVRPDGDCIGSCMGLYLYIKKNFPNIIVDVYLEVIPDAFAMIPGIELVKHKIEKGKAYDLFITLDCGDIDRLGFSAPLLAAAKTKICIDHHVSNAGFGDFCYIVPTASSTSELVYELLDPLLIDKEIAAVLYMGIAHDTGVFRFNSTSPRTMEIAADLLRKGINGNEIIDKTFFEKSFAQTKVTGMVLYQSSLILDGRCIVSTLSKKDMEVFGVGIHELDGIVSQLWLTKDIDVAMFLYESDVNEYKVSLRSGARVDVSRIAAYFGGGGHKRAAGFHISGPVSEAIRTISQELCKEL
ncbi:MAG: bifunctional oligoribonuclease/PAP phosphatase NrnA [Lachnospiraceae bacterium]|nr:bifunctional oligoribonuclease/PAP phosphatase NrnA [Lachnospiraceae bacterium]